MPYKNKQDLYAAQKRHREKIRESLRVFLSGKACVDCGEEDPVVLEFDHIDPNKKFKTINKMMSGHYSWKSLEKEIVKCDVRCANCHRRRTYLQQKSCGRGMLS